MFAKRFFAAFVYLALSAWVVEAQEKRGFMGPAVASSICAVSGDDGHNRLNANVDLPRGYRRPPLSSERSRSLALGR